MIIYYYFIISFLKMYFEDKLYLNIVLIFYYEALREFLDFIIKKYEKIILLTLNNNFLIFQVLSSDFIFS
jgi:hypothetical protein